MIESSPVWRYSSVFPSPVFGAAFHVFEEYILGTLNERHWFCLERDTGSLRWQRKMSGRPNTIVGLQGDVIVATEYRGNDGPWGANFGVYGIRLTDQKLLWTSHAPKPWGDLVRFLDFIPGFTNEFRDDPVLVRDNQIVTSGGRILDVYSGKDVGRMEMTEEFRLSLRTPTQNLLIEKKMDCGALGTLHLGTPETPETPRLVISDKPFQLYRQDAAGNLLWTFDTSLVPEIGEPEMTGLKFRYIEPFVYILVPDRPQKHAYSEKGIEFVPSLFDLWTLDIRSGEIVQKIAVIREPAILGDIEAGDGDTLLISCRSPKNDSITLLNFRRTVTDDLALPIEANEQAENRSSQHTLEDSDR